jgi:hypothetical protein
MADLLTEVVAGNPISQVPAMLPRGGHQPCGPDASGLMAGKLIDDREGEQTAVGLSPVLGGQQVRRGGHGLHRSE